MSKMAISIGDRFTLQRSVRVLDTDGEKVFLPNGVYKVRGVGYGHKCCPTSITLGVGDKIIGHFPAVNLQEVGSFAEDVLAL